MTIAYLYKGGLFNRMERFSEALECCEKALRTQEKRGDDATCLEPFERPMPARPTE